jgi:serine/threonine-protein kinase HipA
VSRRLDVLLHDRPVGTLSELPDGGVEFRFLDSYHELVPRPVLGQKFEDDLERVHRNRKGLGLPDFFANLVPEGRLREVIEKAAELEVGDDLGLLTFVGRDLPGAVVVRPASGGLEAPPSDTPSPSESDDGETSNGALRFSLAGVQLKFSMLLKEDTLTLPAKGEGGEWIVKLHSPSFSQLPENEFSMLSWAQAVGFEVPEFQLRDIDDLSGFPRRYAPSGTKVLAVRRYDRSPRGRIHQEDFAQAVGLPPSKKYDQITYEVMARLARKFFDEGAVDELLRRLTFVVGSGNGDAHLKNWSLVYPDAVRSSWSPVYDQVATVAWEGSYRRELALKLAGVKEFARIERSTFERFGAKAEITSDRVLAQVDLTLERMRASWRSIAFDLPPGHRDAVREHWRTVPLLRAAGSLD